MPKYVQPCDRQNEIRAMERLVKVMSWERPASNFTFKQCSDTSSWDGEVFSNGKLFALVEVRGRNGDKDRYTHWHTRKAKIDKIKAAADKAGVLFILLVTWDGEPFALNVKKTEWESHVSGRLDRGDPADWEELYLIPSSAFKKI